MPEQVRLLERPGHRAPHLQALGLGVLGADVQVRRVQQVEHLAADDRRMRGARRECREPDQDLGLEQHVVVHEQDVGVVGRVARRGVEHAAGEPARAAEVGLAHVPQPRRRARSPTAANRGRDSSGSLPWSTHDDRLDGLSAHRGRPPSRQGVEAVVDTVVGADHHDVGRCGRGATTRPPDVLDGHRGRLGGQLQPQAAAVDEPVDQRDQPHRQSVGVGDVLGGRRSATPCSCPTPSAAPGRCR